ncbi:MAG: hypothetical protein IPG04_13710 [Polyangiaceae bacterium]|nr:hypothetical protein [Polyangiaceae bacterium]
MPRLTRRNEGPTEEGPAEGEVRGEARTLLKLLRLRSFAVDDVTAEGILATTEVAVLDPWVERSLSARSLDGVFGG